jgi:uncharacterized protein YijF (DUF1287 family)
MKPRRLALGSLACGLLASPPAAPEPLVEAARAQIGITRSYDGRYARIPYPGGDVPLERGVCTDVLIRAYRRLGIDLQQRIHEDMAAAWSSYPNPWRQKHPDRSIDHRRVPNLATFFARHGTSLPVTARPADYGSGDIVTWELPRGLPHIGLVSSQSSPAGVPLIIHNIGYGTREEDILFQYRITGHYRYRPER